MTPWRHDSRGRTVFIFSFVCAGASAWPRISSLQPILSIVTAVGLEQKEGWLLDTEWREKHQRDNCMRRLRDTVFGENHFKTGWMSEPNMSAYISCLYGLRTHFRPREKVAYAGGVHYPTVIVANHRFPPVSVSGADWCWLDERGVGWNGMSPDLCCDPNRGMQCWDNHFTYELCCQGEVAGGELPHFFVGPAYDINVASAVRYGGTFDIAQSYAMQALCRRGDMVLDIGANIGGYTVPLAERVGPKGEVHAFEPFRKVFQHLNANVALNGLTNVYTYNFAIGSEDKSIDVHTPDLTTFNFPSAMRVENQYDEQAAEKINVRYEDRRERVTVRRLDSFEFPRTIGFVKIDVEFMELEVIRGGRELLLKDRPIIWSENEHYYSNPPDTRFFDAMSNELGYTCQSVAHLELLCTPKERPKAIPEEFGRVFQHINGNMKDLSRALNEVDPGFNKQGIW